MFNRSVKYIILLAINIAVLLMFYPDMKNRGDGIFETGFVIDLIAERDALKKQLNAAQNESTIASTKATSASLQLEQTQRLILQSEDKYRQCVQEKNNLVTAAAKASEEIKRQQLAAEQSSASFQACEVQSREIALFKAQLKQTEEALKQTHSQKAQLNNKIFELEKQLNEQLESLTQPQEKNEALISQLKARIAKLEADIENPIYLKSAYLSGKACDNSRFEDLVCIEEFIVRPKFSKAPITEVTVNIYAPDRRRVAQGTFASERTQLVRLPLGRARDLLAGEYSAEFIVNNETLVSNGHLIVKR
ncbi:hypothetical protein [Agaribacter flavus]|uniref:Chromosome segregation ATPase n=1 Tax=Agaribacter flavus TaxID=1902781 RepID=A0ABV7FJD0_9ALTE